MSAVIIIGLIVVVASLAWLATQQSKALKKYEKATIKKTRASRKTK